MRRSLPVSVCLLLVQACGYSAEIEVIQSFYDSSRFIAAQRCGTGQNVVDVVYALLNSRDQLMTEQDPLFGARGAAAVTVDAPEPFTIEGRSETVTVSVSGNAYVEVTRPGRARAVALMMDNSASLNGTNELDGSNAVLTDPRDTRISAAQNFISNGLFPRDAEDDLHPNDKATVIAFHGDGANGVDAKMRRTPTEAPAESWFSPSETSINNILGQLNTEENGKTPLYDAIGVGVEALRKTQSSFRRVMVLFSDGPDNASTSTFDDARAALTGNPHIPLFAIGLDPLTPSAFGADGHQRLQDLACATTPQGVYMRAPRAADLEDRFKSAELLITGYWKATLDLQIPQGLPSGTYNVSGKLFAHPEDQPRSCADGCSTGDLAMECDSGTQTCYMPTSFTVTVP